MLSKGKINDVKSSHFTYGYQVLENIIKHNPSVSVRELQKTYGTGLVWEVATLNTKLQKLLGAETRVVWISEQTLIKQIVHRNGQPIGIEEYRYIDEIINNADDFFPTETGLMFFKRLDRWYQVAMKLTQDKKELYITTLHRVPEKEYERVKRMMESKKGD